MAASLTSVFLLQRKSLMWRVMRIVRDRHVAEDLAQEAYLRAWRAHEAAPIAHPEGFLHQTARNLALDHMTAVGERMSVALPDGSAMQLNSATAVALDFAGGRREVRLLEGEAFFDVRSDAAHPFRVVGHFGTVEVKGTAFAVRLEPREDQVVLERGKVEVALRQDPQERVDLHPGQMVGAGASVLSAPRVVDPAQALAWREGRIVFDDQPLADVLAELGRYRSGMVLVMDPAANGLRVSGNYRLDDVDGAIRTLADAAGVAISRLPGGIVILR